MKEVGRKRERKGGTEGRRWKNFYGIIQGRPLFKFTHSLAFLCKFWFPDLLGKEKIGPLTQRAVPPGYLSCLWLLLSVFACVLRPQLVRYIVTPPSLTDQDSFPTVRIILSTALGNPRPSEFACKMEQTHHCWLSMLINTSLSHGPFHSSELPLRIQHITPFWEGGSWFSLSIWLKQSTAL